MNSKSHARLRRLQVNRQITRVWVRLIDFICENNRQMFDAMIEDCLLGRTGRWSMSDDGVLTYDRVHTAMWSPTDGASVDIKE
jgi:hypothetical protein